MATINAGKTIMLGSLKGLSTKGEKVFEDLRTYLQGVEAGIIEVSK